MLSSFIFENATFSPSDWRGRWDPFHHELCCHPLPSINTNSGEGERCVVHTLFAGFLKSCPCWMHCFYTQQSKISNSFCAFFEDTAYKLNCVTEAASKISHKVEVCREICILLKPPPNNTQINYVAWSIQLFLIFFWYFYALTFWNSSIYCKRNKIVIFDTAEETRFLIKIGLAFHTFN